MMFSWNYCKGCRPNPGMQSADSFAESSSVHVGTAMPSANPPKLRGKTAEMNKKFG